MILGQDKICVFISYSHQDRQICEQIAGYMAARNAKRDICDAKA